MTNMAIKILLCFVLLATLSFTANARTIEGIPGFGKNLIIRSLAPVPDFQSNLFEVYMEPYFYDHVRPPLQALVMLSGINEGVGGDLILSQWSPGGPVMLQGNITGLSPGLHGLHVAQRGDLRQGCTSTGRHFNPYLHRHGGPRDSLRHLGDLGNVKAGDDGVARIRIVDHLVSLLGPRNVVGRSLVITSSEDDLGRAGTEESALNGSSGEPVACGIIAYLS